MAKALECPACGAKHRLDGLVPSSTFRCERCGQKLKVPASVAASLPSAPRGPAPAAPRRAPPPRRRPGGQSSSTVIGASATVDATGAATRSVGDDNGQAPPASRTTGTATDRARRVRWYWRLLAWVVAVPLGFLVGVVPAYEFGFIEKDDVLDVFVGSGVDRYIRVGIVTLFWALATAILVQLFVEGGRRWAQRRRRSRETRTARAARTPRRAATGA